MTGETELGDTSSPSAQTLTVRVPVTFRRYGGRKAVLVPAGTRAVATRHEVLSPLIRALARAHRWRKLLESEAFSSIAELATAEKIDKSYVSKILRLTLLAPDTVERILDPAQPEPFQVDRVLQPFPVEWSAQRKKLGAIG